MSVWQSIASPGPLLYGREGELVSVSIHVAPRDLEALLEALARLEFPINPQIYHDAALIYRYPDGQEEAEPVTIVEFPAWATHLDEVRGGLLAQGFDESCLYVAHMLEDLHGDAPAEPAPTGARWVSRVRRKNGRAAAA
jgi:hypothetical protein